MSHQTNSYSPLDSIAFKWPSNDESVAFDVAREAISGLIGVYSALMAFEMQKTAPDMDAMAHNRAAQATLAQQIKDLNPEDVLQIATIRQDYPKIAEQLRLSINHA